jgi:uncharacterized protein YhjY with autotransporter beta-barrel domain
MRRMLSLLCCFAVICVSLTGGVLVAHASYSPWGITLDASDFDGRDVFSKRGVGGDVYVEKQDGVFHIWWDADPEVVPGSAVDIKILQGDIVFAGAGISVSVDSGNTNLNIVGDGSLNIVMIRGAAELILQSMNGEIIVTGEGIDGASGSITLISEAGAGGGIVVTAGEELIGSGETVPLDAVDISLSNGAISIVGNGNTVTVDGNTLTVQGNMSGTVTLSDNTSAVLRSIVNSGHLSVGMLRVLGFVGSQTSVEAVAKLFESFGPDTDGSNPRVPVVMMDQFVGAQMAHLGGVSPLALGYGASGMSAGDQSGQYSTWFKGFGSYAHQDPRGGSKGYNLSNGGGAIGVEKSLSDIFKMGVAFGDSQSWVRSKDYGGRTQINATQLSLYGGLKPLSAPWYLNGSLNYAYDQYDGSREIYASPTRIARSEYRGDLYGAAVESGYGMKFDKVLFTPFVSMSYSHLHLAGHAETGAGDYNLDIAAQDYDNLRGGVGARLQYEKKLASVTLTPEIHAKYLYDIIADRQSIVATFGDGAISFSTQGYKPARSGVDVGGSLMLATKNDVSVSLQYDLELREDYYAHTGVFNVVYDF